MNAETAGDAMLWKNMLAVADPRERRVIICLRARITRVSGIAAELGRLPKGGRG